MKLLNLSALKLNDKHNYYGGAIGNICFNLLYSLSSNFDLEIHTLTEGVDLTKPLPTNLKLHHAINRGKAFTFFPNLEVDKILKEEKFSAITHFYLHEPEFNPMLWKIRNYPIVIGMCELPHPRLNDEVNGISKYPVIRSIGKKMVFPFFKKTLKYCDSLIVVNEAAKDYYSKFIQEDKIRIIPYGVDLTRFKYSPSPQNHNVLAVSRLIKRRGLDYLVEAMPKVLKEFPDACLHFVGEGPRKQILQRRAEELSIEKNVVFHGQVPAEKLVELYRNCEIFCHLSFADGWNQPALEAMASGRSVICTDAPHNSMVVDKKTGFLIPFGDVDMLVEKIMVLFGDKGLAERMGMEGRKKVENEYNWNDIARAYYNTFQEVMG